MKKFINLLIVALSAVIAVSCLIRDTPSVEFSEESYIVPAAGGELIIPVHSTGVDDVTVKFSDRANWEVDDNGDMIPTEGWLKIVKIVDRYNATRDLAAWTSGIAVTIEPNEGNFERTAYITVNSFTAYSTVRVTQSGAFVE